MERLKYKFSTPFDLTTSILKGYPGQSNSHITWSRRLVASVNEWESSYESRQWTEWLITRLDRVGSLWTRSASNTNPQVILYHQIDSGQAFNVNLPNHAHRWLTFCEALSINWLKPLCRPGNQSGMCLRTFPRWLEKKHSATKCLSETDSKVNSAEALFLAYWAKTDEKWFAQRGCQLDLSSLFRAHTNWLLVRYFHSHPI